MATLISTVAVALVALLFIFVLKRVFGLLFGRKKHEATLHEDLLDVAEDIAGASKVAATLASMAAFFAAPAGLLALAATFGLAPIPLIVTIVPALLAFAAGAIVLSALAKLYAKAVRKRRPLTPSSEA